MAGGSAVRREWASGLVGGLHLVREAGGELGREVDRTTPVEGRAGTPGGSVAEVDAGLGADEAPDALVVIELIGHPLLLLRLLVEPRELGIDLLFVRRRRLDDHAVGRGSLDRRGDLGVVACLELLKLLAVGGVGGGDLGGHVGQRHQLELRVGSGQRLLHGQPHGAGVRTASVGCIELGFGGALLRLQLLAVAFDRCASGFLGRHDADVSVGDGGGGLASEGEGGEEQDEVHGWLRGRGWVCLGTWL